MVWWEKKPVWNALPKHVPAERRAKPKNWLNKPKPPKKKPNGAQWKELNWLPSAWAPITESNNFFVDVHKNPPNQTGGFFTTK